MIRQVYALLAFALIALVFGAAIANAQGPTGGPKKPSAAVGTGFTYQGQLKNNSGLVNGSCDFQFGLWDDPATGPQYGATQTVSSLLVTNGLFTTQLNFGIVAPNNVFTGTARYMQSAVRCPAAISGLFTALTPRQALTPAPYALALPGLYTQQNATSPNVIGGYSANSVASNIFGAAIGGGGGTIYGDGSSVCGSCYNRISANYGTISGGINNTISGAGNTATIGGGESNSASGIQATVGGGRINQATGPKATIGGGDSNTASGQFGTVGGGELNTAGDHDTVGGGLQNTANGIDAVIGGGFHNTSTGAASTVPGGENNSATGWYAFAAGRHAKANHQGAFVWGDSNSSDFSSTGDNQFLIRSNGGVGVNTNSPTANTLTVGGSGLRVATDGTTFARIQSGEATLGTGSAGVTNVYTVTFPSAFSSTPKVTATTRNDPGWDVGDTFAATVRKISTTQFVVNVFRVDGAGVWSQSLRLDWIAWE